jgi:conjugative relaxase-like TrwC/TraI family protein
MLLCPARRLDGLTPAMLSIGKLARGQADYYLEQAKGRVDHATSVESGAEDYYLGGPEAKGYWLGSIAAELDLSRTVSDDGFQLALAGAHPSTGAVLTSGSPNRVPGFDLTFSAPKSVSVLFGVGGERVQGAIRSAHDRAVEDALGYLERSAAKGRRGHDGLVTINGSGLLAAAFRHRTSRAGDPQLHTHVVVANVVHGADGRWSALDARLIYAHAKTAGYLYEARLRAELTRSLGVAWTPVKRGIADVEGVPQEVLRAFSRRRVEIEEEFARRGRVGAVAAQVVALATRRRKDYGVTPERLAPEWRERAAALGFDAASVERLLGRAQALPLQQQVREGMFDALATPAGLTEQKSTFTRRDVIQAVCERMPTATDISVRGVEQVAGLFLRSRRAVPLAVRDAVPQRTDVIRRQDGRVVAAVRDEQRYSTPELLAVEGALIACALAGRRAGAGLARQADVERAIAKRPTLSDEQSSRCGVSRSAVSAWWWSSGRRARARPLRSAPPRSPGRRRAIRSSVRRWPVERPTSWRRGRGCRRRAWRRCCFSSTVVLSSRRRPSWSWTRRECWQPGPWRGCSSTSIGPKASSCSSAITDNFQSSGPAARFAGSPSERRRHTSSRTDGNTKPGSAMRWRRCGRDARATRSTCTRSTDAW